MGDWVAEKLNVMGHGARVSLARAMNVTPDIVTKITKGQRLIKASEIAAIQKFFGEQIPDFVIDPSFGAPEIDQASMQWDGDETHPPPNRKLEAAVSSREIYPGSGRGIIPEVDAAAGAGDGQVGEVVQIQSGGIQSGHKVVAEWQVPPDITRHMLGVDPRQILILPVRGDSMEPTLRNGDRIIVDLTDASPNDGGIYVIDEGFGPMVKRIRPIAGTDPLMVEIISDNQFVGRYQLLAEQVRVIGRARGRWSAI